MSAAELMDVFAPFSVKRRVTNENCFGSPIVRIAKTARSNHLKIFWVSLDILLKD
jgi:hypothetical protein